MKEILCCASHRQLATSKRFLAGCTDTLSPDPGLSERPEFPTTKNSKGRPRPPCALNDRLLFVASTSQSCKSIFGRGKFKAISNISAVIVHWRSASHILHEIPKLPNASHFFEERIHDRHRQSVNYFHVLSRPAEACDRRQNYGDSAFNSFLAPGFAPDLPGLRTRFVFRSNRSRNLRLPSGQPMVSPPSYV